MALDEIRRAASLASNVLTTNGLSLSQPQDLWKRSHFLSGRPASPIHFNYHEKAQSFGMAPPKPPRDDGRIKTDAKKREIYRFQAGCLVSNLAWSATSPSSTYQLALSSFLENFGNYVQIISLDNDEYDQELKSDVIFQHPYPPTKILWEPRCSSRKGQSSQLLATTSDNLKIWSIEHISDEDKSQAQVDGSESISGNDNSAKCTHRVSLACQHRPNEEYKYSAPMTSFDWNEKDSSILVTTAVDAICTIWNIEVGQQTGNTRVHCTSKDQLVAHNKEIFDVSFTKLATGRECFVTSGGDGTVKLLDTRHLPSTNTIFEADWSTSKRALVRVACNKVDPNLLATFAIESNSIIVLDIRKPKTPVTTLNNHTRPVNSMMWAPNSAHHMCSVSDDQQALIWELLLRDGAADEPALAYRANGGINVTSWSGAHPDWIAIAYGDLVEMLRV